MAVDYLFQIVLMILLVLVFSIHNSQVYLKLVDKIRSTLGSYALTVQFRSTLNSSKCQIFRKEKGNSSSSFCSAFLTKNDNKTTIVSEFFFNNIY